MKAVKNRRRKRRREMRDEQHNCNKIVGYWQNLSILLFGPKKLKQIRSIYQKIPKIVAKLSKNAFKFFR